MGRLSRNDWPKMAVSSLKRRAHTSVGVRPTMESAPVPTPALGGAAGVVTPVTFAVDMMDGDEVEDRNDGNDGGNSSGGVETTSKTLNGRRRNETRRQVVAGSFGEDTDWTATKTVRDDRSEHGRWSAARQE